MFSSMKASWWQVLKLPSFPNRSFGGSRQVIPRKYVQPSTFVQEDLPLSFKMLAKVFNCFWTWMFFKKNVFLWDYGRVHHSIDSFLLRKGNFPEIHLWFYWSRGLLYCILEFLNTWWSNLAPEIKRQQEQQIHSWLFVDPSQKLNTHTTPLTVATGFRWYFKIGLEAWGLVIGKRQEREVFFPSWLLVWFKGHIKSPMHFWCGFSPVEHFPLFRQTSLKIYEVELVGDVLIKIWLWIQIKKLLPFSIFIGTDEPLAFAEHVQHFCLHSFSKIAPSQVVPKV